MDKKKIKQIVALVVVVAVVALLAAMPVIAKQEPEEDGPKASILNGQVTSGSIPTELIGGGQLAQEDAVTVSVPAEVKLKSFQVSNGDAVTEGQAIASVDRVSVMQAITQVQETLEYLSEEIEKASDITIKENVTALAGGTVKLLYGKKGDSVQKVMLEHGALAVLSLDGLMAVDLETESTVKAGTAVKVLLPTGKTVTGKVAKNLAGEMTVTIEDKGYQPGAAVEITDSEGGAIGAGEMYIYSPWNATAYAGTIESVKVSVGDTLSAGKTLMVLKNVGYSAAYRQLIGQRQEYEALMLELFKMYQTETLTAPCDGVVTGIDKNSVQLLKSSGDFTLDLLANAPNGNDTVLYLNYLGKISLVAANGWALQVAPQAVAIADYKQLTAITPDESLMTESVLFTQTELPVFTLVEDTWVQADRATIEQGDLLLFAADAQGNLVWCVLVQKASAQPENPGGGQTPGGNQGGGNQGSGSFPGGGNFPSGGGNFGNMGGGMTEEEVFELYGLTMTQVAQVTSQNTMTLDITIDEQDMRYLSLGMTAQVKIDALGGEKHTATITQLGNSGTNNGGSSKYTVQLTMERAGEMLSGMNATATIVLASTRQVLTVPAAALVEQGNETVVYTGYDEKKEALINPVTVTVGVSDGETVEILEGLTEGQTYYYAYYDTLEVSNTPEFGSFGSFGGRGGSFFGR